MTGPWLPIVLAAGDAAAAAGPDPFLEVATRGGAALLIGLLIGAEREFSHTEKEQLFAGVRTFPLISLLGFTAAMIAALAGSPLVFAAVALCFGLLIVSTYVLTSLGEDKGATTEIAGLTAFFLGALCFYGTEVDPRAWSAHGVPVKFASAAAVVAAVLLSMREAIHGVVGKFEKDDIHATLKLAIVTLIVLPLLPDRMYTIADLLGAEVLQGAPQGLRDFKVINPNKIWYYVVLIAGISFLGYVGVKVFGARMGVGLTGIFGGLSSSTATTLAFSKKSREEPAMARSFATAIVLASTIMFPRCLVVAAAACPPLLVQLWKPVAILCAVGVVASAILHFGAPKDEHAAEGVKFKNPFELGSAVKFGFVLAGIGIVSRASHQLFGEKAFYLASVLVGMADADGFASQAADQGKAALAAAEPGAAVPFLATAATAIVLAMLSNTVVKGSLTVTIGAKELRRYTVTSFAAMVVVGVIAAFLLV